MSTLPTATPTLPTPLLTPEDLAILNAFLTRKLSPSEFMSRFCYVKLGDTTQPIQLLPHQKLILDYAFSHNFQNIVYSTVKKSGKTAIAGMLALWIAATHGPLSEVYCFASDQEQAKGRIYKAASDALYYHPQFNARARSLSFDDVLTWEVTNMYIRHAPTGSLIKPVACDYKGEAGSNPTASLWSELWAYCSEQEKRLWDELTPPPTRTKSYRIVETYAGYEKESDLLIALYEAGKKYGRRLTHEEFPWPYADDPPVYVNEKMRLVMYWDEGSIARRMPWQTPEYYAVQAATLRPSAFNRFHNNYWVASESAFVPVEWWRKCAQPLPPSIEAQPVIMAVDASISNDCTAIVGWSRHPEDDRKVVKRFHTIITPSKDHTVQAEEVKAIIRSYSERFNIAQVAYDPYQLHHLMQEVSQELGLWCFAFQQGQPRLQADKQLYDLIVNRRLIHDGDPECEQHISNADAKEVQDKLRIVKRRNDKPIDFVVASSMAVHECLRLAL